MIIYFLLFFFLGIFILNQYYQCKSNKIYIVYKSAPPVRRTLLINVGFATYLLANTVSYFSYLLTKVNYQGYAVMASAEFKKALCNNIQRDLEDVSCSCIIVWY